MRLVTEFIRINQATRIVITAGIECTENEVTSWCCVSGITPDTGTYPGKMEC